MESYLLPVAYSVCVLLGIFLAIYDLRRYKTRSNYVMLSILILVIPGIIWLNNSSSDSSIAFGDGYKLNPFILVFVMLVCVMLGIAAAYAFNSSEKFRLRDFIRPFVISPIVLLPLLGSLPASEVGAVQIISILIMAFQNGFFWQRIFKDVKVEV